MNIDAGPGAAGAITTVGPNRVTQVELKYAF